MSTFRIYKITQIALLVLVLSAVHKLQAQDSETGRFRGMLAAGMNVSQIDGDFFKGFNKFGATGGVGVYIMFNQRWSTLVEIAYSQRGSKLPRNNTFAFLPQYDYAPRLTDPRYIERIIQLDYLEIPLTVNYHDRKFAIFNFGFTVGRQIRYNERILFVDQPDFDPVVNQQMTASRDSIFSGWDLSITGGVTFMIKGRYGIDLRFQRSLFKLGTFDETQIFVDGGSVNTRTGYYNTGLSLRFIYVLTGGPFTSGLNPQKAGQPIRK